jgi:hypothetical protein
LNRYSGPLTELTGTSTGESDAATGRSGSGRGSWSADTVARGRSAESVTRRVTPGRPIWMKRIV